VFFRTFTSLAVTDGTREGTTTLLNALAPFAPSGVEALAAHGGRVYFGIRSATSELWSTDGTKEGTRPADGAWTHGLRPTELVSHEGRLFMSGVDEHGGRQLVSTDDGCNAATAVLSPAAANAEPTHLTSIGGRLLFTRTRQTSDGARSIGVVR